MSQKSDQKGVEYIPINDNDDDGPSLFAGLWTRWGLGFVDLYYVGAIRYHNLLSLAFSFRIKSFRFWRGRNLGFSSPLLFRCVLPFCSYFISETHLLL